MREVQIMTGIWRVDRALVVLAVCLGCTVAMHGCKRAEERPGAPQAEETRPGAISLSSSAFAAGRPIPQRHTADGEDVSPAVNWSGVPEGAKELALIVDDPDAPRKDPWVHWVIYKIPATAAGLGEAVPPTERLNAPPGAMQGRNTSGTIGYRGPSPPPGPPHRYRFKLYALSEVLDLEPGLDAAALEAAMAGRVLARGELVGTYGR